MIKVTTPGDILDAYHWQNPGVALAADRGGRPHHGGPSGRRPRQMDGAAPEGQKEQRRGGPPAGCRTAGSRTSPSRVGARNAPLEPLLERKAEPVCRPQ